MLHLAALALNAIAGWCPNLGSTIGGSAGSSGILSVRPSPTSETSARTAGTRTRTMSTNTEIIGWSSGMGLALAKRCLETGARVTIVGRDEARLAGARQALGNPATLHVFAADITREDQVGNLFASL